MTLAASDKDYIPAAGLNLAGKIAGQTGLDNPADLQENVVEQNLKKSGSLREKIENYRKHPFDLLRVAFNLLNARFRLRKCTRGRLVQVMGRPRIINRGEMIFGDKAMVDSITARSELVCEKGGRLEIGERAYINYGTSIAAHQLVKIGKLCRIGTYCNITDNDFHGIEDRMTLPPSDPVILEDNVWLGAKVVVLKGVTIGHDSVIGAGSVVTKDIPPRCIAAGVPAKVIRKF